MTRPRRPHLRHRPIMASILTLRVRSSVSFVCVTAARIAIATGRACYGSRPASSAGGRRPDFWDNSVGQEEARRWIVQQLDSANLFPFDQLDSIAADCMGGRARQPRSVWLMNEAVKIDDLIIEVRRSKRRKTIGLTVDRDASLIAHLPEATSLEEASNLIKSKLIWIHQKLASQEKSPTGSVFRRPELWRGLLFSGWSLSPEACGSQAGRRGDFNGSF